MADSATARAEEASVMVLPSRVVSSNGTTQSAPAGRTAPVMISTQVSGASSSLSGRMPAACVP